MQIPKWLFIFLLVLLLFVSLTLVLVSFAFTSLKNLSVAPQETATVQQTSVVTQQIQTISAQLDEAKALELLKQADNEKNRIWQASQAKSLLASAIYQKLTYEMQKETHEKMNKLVNEFKK